jgi:hypothetical protein
VKLTGKTIALAHNSLRVVRRLRSAVWQQHLRAKCKLQRTLRVEHEVLPAFVPSRQRQQLLFSQPHVLLPGCKTHSRITAITRYHSRPCAVRIRRHKHIRALRQEYRPLTRTRQVRPYKPCAHTQHLATLAARQRTCTLVGPGPRISACKAPRHAGRQRVTLFQLRPRQARHYRAMTTNRYHYSGLRILRGAP